MPYAVLRLYNESGPLVGAIREARDEVEAIMRAIPGFVRYGIIDTGGGAISMTVCDDKAGTDASIKAAADWIKSNLPDAKIASPRVLEGEVIHDLSHKRGEPGPHAVLRIFDAPPPDGIDQHHDAIREVMTGTSGFRAYTVVGARPGGVSLIVCDDKAGTDKAAEGMRALVRSKYPDFPPRNPEVIEGTGVFRFEAAEVPAATA
ncbi:MAG TPA: hypothetical protein VGJ60_11055 [Chloroflexota bacterium]|jgi:hypothetical protein